MASDLTYEALRGSCAQAIGRTSIRGHFMITPAPGGYIVTRLALPHKQRMANFRRRRREPEPPKTSVLDLL